MSKDVVNIPLEECKQLILEYQKTKDSKIFNELLAKFDNYLAYLVRKFEKQYVYLRNEESQELYHIAILGFHQGILSLHPYWRSEGILLWVGSYIKFALKKTFRYKQVEISSDELLGTFLDKNAEKSEEDEINWNILLDSDVLTEDEKEYIKLRFEQNMYLKEIAEIKKVSYGMVYYNLNKILKKLKQKFIEGGEERG